MEGHRIISGLETLAQTVPLIMARDVLANRCGPCFLPMESDNLGTVGTVNNMFSTKWPMAYFTTQTSLVESPPWPVSPERAGREINVSLSTSRKC